MAKSVKEKSGSKKPASKASSAKGKSSATTTSSSTPSKPAKPKASSKVEKSKPLPAPSKGKSAAVKAPKAEKATPLAMKQAPNKSKKGTAKDKSKHAKPAPVPPAPIVATVKAKFIPTIEIKKPVTKTTTKPDSSPTTNGKTRYSDVELAEFKALIDEKLAAARQELNYLQEQIVEMNENNSDIQGSDWFDDSSIHSEVELLNNMAIRQRQFIQNLENALVRIENKTYGICTVTGHLIDKKRLLLVPHATKSIEAKHIEQANLVPDINQVAPDERVLRRTVEGKAAKKGPVKKVKGKTVRDFEEDEGEELTEAPVDDIDMNFDGGEG
jgi:RNA polymerase-binding transcription factor DksA